MIEITKLNTTLVGTCRREFSKIGWTKPDGYFAACLEQQTRDQLIFFAAIDESHYIGHVKLVWASDYTHFREAGIPEINDLNVLPDYRKQGIGTRLIRCCEAAAADAASQGDRSPCAIGIGVGLHPGYNAAQRLYTKLGYILDGHGVHYDGVPVEAGEFYRFDDDLILYFTKALDKPSAISDEPSAGQTKADG